MPTDSRNKYEVRTPTGSVWWYGFTSKQVREEAKEAGHQVVAVRLVKEGTNAD